MTTPDELRQFISAARASSGVTWSDASLVSVPRKYVSMANAKVACSTLKLAVHTFEDPDNPIEWWETHADWPGWHALDFDDDLVLEMLSSAGWFRFCFVRNPYDRLVSAWKSKLVSDQDEGYGWLRGLIRDATGQPAISFRDAFDYVTGADAVARRDPHWLPQVTLLRPDLVSYDEIGRFETFSEDFRRIFGRVGAPPKVMAMADTRYNATPDSDWRDCFDTELAARVHDFYREDFAAFGYSGDSWSR